MSNKEQLQENNETLENVLYALANNPTATELQIYVDEHKNDSTNPHNVTKAQVGLNNVPNVTTNDQTPTYSEASTLATLTSGEKLSVSMGKIKKAITDFISHKGSTSNPHSVTKSQVGLGNVDNTSDANKPVSTAQATAIADAKKAGTDAQAALADYLPISGGALTGSLTVKDNFNINKTYDSTEYKTYVRPLNYALGDVYTTGLIHYVGTTNNSQLMFNNNGVMLRDNVDAKAYQMFGQHNAATAATSVRSHLYTYGTTDMTAGSSSLETGKLYFVYE